MLLPGVRAAKQSVLIALAASFWTYGQAAGYGFYNPCTTPGLATKSKGVYLGVAFWPGGTISDWGIISETLANATAPLYPCTTNNNYNNTGLSDQAFLISKGVVFAAYELKVDSLMSLRVNYTDLLPLYQTVPILSGGRPNVISAVMFRGGYRSEARYVVSEDTGTTKGVGWVTALAGIIRFSKGKMEFLQWNDMTCNKCGGRSDTRCVQGTTGTDSQRSCATVATSCGVNGTDCSMQLYVGASGDDKYGVAFSSGWMVQEINRFSVLSLYDNSKMDLTNAATSNADAVIGVTPSASTGDGVAR